MTNRILFNIPNPMYSIQQYDRHHHLDIPDLTDEAIQEELWSLRPLLFRLPPSKEWIKERVFELTKESNRRRYSKKVQARKRIEDCY